MKERKKQVILDRVGRKINVVATQIGEKFVKMG